MIIYLISGPRNISTALMYAFHQRPDTVVMDEPFHGIQVKQMGKKQPYFDEIMLRMECDDAEKIHDQIKENEKIKGNVFVKNMANTVQYMKENRLLNCRYIFLIRNPGETLASRMQMNSSVTPEDLDLAEQVRIYNWIKENTNDDPIVIDGDHLRRDPGIILTKACQRLNLPFTDKMLSWRAGPKSVDGLWAQASYTDVHASTGFRPPSVAEVTREDLPDHLAALYDDAFPHYEKLLSHSI